jgi:hypothetical protein
MKRKATAGAVVTGAASCQSSGSDFTKRMHLLLHNTEKQKIAKGVNDQRF